MTRARTTATDFIVAPRRDLCLDFANTVAWRGSTSEESLRDFPELIRWCDANVMPGGGLPERAARWAEKHPREADALFRGAIDIREAIYRIFFAIAEEKTPNAGDITAVNRALEAAPARTEIGREGRRFGWRVAQDGFTAPGLIAPVLWSAADLMINPDSVRVRHCSNDKCLWLFFDDSKNGSRRWCSMQACGNRAKAHRHYLRTKG
jgi:predicted RNA-binding Zn ribbon-like protein